MNLSGNTILITGGTSGIGLELATQLSGISDLVTFAQGLEKEGSALHAAFTLPYSNDHVA